jgi:hypothetical protein
MSVEAGRRYCLLRDHGNPPLHLPKGSVGVVREIVPAAVPGAHNSEEDAAVLEFDSHGLAFDDAGQPTIATSPRAAAFALTDFEGPDALFEETT